MTAANASTIFNLQPKTRILTQARRLVLTTLLAFGVAVPFASAGCLGKALTQPHPVSNVLANPLPAARPDAPLPEINSASLIVGLWNLEFFYQGQVVDVAFDVWHSDGTEILNDYTDPIEGNVCLGVWEQTGPSSYQLKHPSWSFDENGNLLGTVVIHENVALSRDGNSFSGKYAYDVYDVDGNFQYELTGKLAATRIKAN